MQTKENWSDEWTTQANLLLETATHNAGANDLDAATFTWRYGNICQPGQTAFAAVAPLAINGHWIRVVQISGETTTVLWVGRVYGEGRTINGLQAETPTGVQRWQAFGPQMILRKTMIGQSVWTKPAGSSIEGDNWLDWSPPMNDRVGQQALVIGNRSDDAVAPTGSTGEGSFVFGGTNTWSAFDFVTYILTWWLDWSFETPEGPKFTLSDPGAICWAWSSPRSGRR